VRSLSIRFRLTIWYAATLVLTVAVFGGGIWLALQHSIRRTVDKDLRLRLDAMRHYIDQQMRGGGYAHLQQELAEDVDVVAAGPVRIASSARVWIYGSPGTEAWELAVPKMADLPLNGIASTIVVRGQALRLLTAPVTIGVVQLGLPLGDFQQVTELLAWILFLGSPLLLLLASVGGYWISGRTLKPVDDLATTAQNIGAQNLTDRLPIRGKGDEFDRLSEVLNGMLARLDSAFARVTRFTADASHELRTPVAIVRTTAEVTRARTRTVEEHEKAWGVIVTQAARMSQLIDDLLMLARVDSESRTACPELVDGAAILCETCAEMQTFAETSGVRLAMRVPRQCTMFADSEDLHRIFLILLDNAIKYTASGGQIVVELDVSGTAVRGTVVVRVRDTGVGISQDDLPHIFERFYRAAKDRSRKTGGAGLGLTIAKHLAEHHGGKIEVESTLGVGSTFCLFLPILPIGT
jgi:signal transduction histidine kinase